DSLLIAKDTPRPTVPEGRIPARGEARAGVVPGGSIDALRRALPDRQPGQRRIPYLPLFGGRAALPEDILRAKRLPRSLVNVNRLTALVAGRRSLDAVVQSQRDGERGPEAPDIIEVRLEIVTMPGG